MCARRADAATPAAVKQTLAEVAKVTGRHRALRALAGVVANGGGGGLRMLAHTHGRPLPPPPPCAPAPADALFEYAGHPEAEDVVVLMGSAVSTVQETVAYANSKLGGKLGVLNVRLFRPWSAADFIAALPKSTKRVAVLDRMKEAGAQGEPLLQDVMCCLYEAGLGGKVNVVGGRYGLGSRDLTPAGVLAVFENLGASAPLKRFTVGIDDDVSHLSLKVGPEPELMPAGTKECLFWGLGADGAAAALARARAGAGPTFE